MDITMDQLVDIIIEVDARAESLGMYSADVAFGFMIGALAIGDKNISGGLSKDQFLKIAGTIYDKSRGSLMAGRSA